MARSVPSRGVRALELCGEWPVATWAAAVVEPSGVRAVGGATRHRFPLASVTKLLTALAVAVAIEEGSVHPDDPAGPPGSTLAHLLAHASGLAPDEERPVAPPASRRIYSNAGYEVAARHVEAATGMPFATYLSEALPLPGTRLEGSPAHGGLATVDDMATVAGWMLAPGLVAAGTLEWFRTPLWPHLGGVLPGFGRFEPNPWGPGPEVRGDKHPHWTGTANSPATFGHFGRAGTFVWVDPAVDVALVVLTDRPFGPWAAREWPRLSDAVLAELGR